MILNISLALLKSRDHVELLTLHSLFHPSSHFQILNLSEGKVQTAGSSSCSLRHLNQARVP